MTGKLIYIDEDGDIVDEVALPECFGEWDGDSDCVCCRWHDECEMNSLEDDDDEYA